MAHTWRTTKASGAAAPMVATLLVPIHIAVSIDVILSLLLVGIGSASATRAIARERVAPGQWRRTPAPTTHPAGQVTVIDNEGSGAFAALPALFARLPQPPDSTPDATTPANRLRSC